MPVSKEFIRAWRAWQHAPSPYSNKYLLHQSIATSKIEHDLDHIESYLYVIGLNAIEGKNYDYAEIAGRELSDLDRIVSELESCDLAESEKEIFRQHIDIVRAVWLEMQKLILAAAQPNNSFNRSGISLLFIRQLECLVRCVPPR